MTPEELASYTKAGRICAQARAYGASLIKEGVTLLSVCQAVEAKIRELGGEPAFPAQISVNHVAAHYCPDPDDETVFETGDLCKLDCGVHIDGYIADTAITVDLGENKALVQASRDACEAALALCKPGTEMRALGKVIEDTIIAAGFQPIRNLGGHGLSRYVIHDSRVSIPNHDNGDTRVLEAGMVIAVEPFATTGAGKVRELDRANIYSLEQKKPVRSPYARKVLDEAARYNGLPFTAHWTRLGQKPFEVGMRELLQVGAVHAYPPLIEVEKGTVSQHEHSVIITKDGALVYTRD
jgi:methionyl aminopeptidase